MDIIGALAVVGQGLNIAKGLKEIKEGYDTAEFKIKMAELMSALADAKVALIDAQDDLRAKDQEIERLKRSFEIRADFVELKGFKYGHTPDGKPEGEPYCPRCEQNKARFYRLTKINGRPLGELRCPECDATYAQVTTYPWR